VLAESGEDAICFSDESDYAANIEKVAFSKQEKINSSSAYHPTRNHLNDGPIDLHHRQNPPSLRLNNLQSNQYLNL
jgi:prolyl-tRNA synthetase